MTRHPLIRVNELLDFIDLMEGTEHGTALKTVRKFVVGLRDSERYQAAIRNPWLDVEPDPPFPVPERPT